MYKGVDVIASLRFPDRITGRIQRVEQLYADRLAAGLVKVPPPATVTLWSEHKPGLARITNIDGDCYVVDVLVGGTMRTLAGRDPDAEVAPLIEGAAALRGIPLLWSHQILGVMTAARAALYWVDTCEPLAPLRIAGDGWSPVAAWSARRK